MLTENNIKTCTGASAIIETLKSLGVDTIFGYPGGMVLNLYDELYKQNDIKHILVRHEQSAIHAAEGYAKTSGKCGVVLVTSGPGATNTITGIVNAYLDGTPVVVLCGQVNSELIGKNAFQEANICDMTKSCTKKVFQVTQAEELQQTLQEAFKIAQEPKKGPVVIDLPKNILQEKVSIEVQRPSIKEKIQIFDYKINSIETLLKKTKSPVIVAGGGVKASDAEAELFKFSKAFGIPVVSTMMGLGTFPQNDINYFGMIGIFGNVAANELVKKSDLIISLGARFNDRITCMFEKSDLEQKIIQIDINNDEISNSKSILGICADIKDFVSFLNDNLKLIDYSLWLKNAQSLKHLNKENKKNSNMLHSFEVMNLLENYTKNRDVIFTTEVGQHQLWAIRNLTFNKNRPILVSGGAGTMGYGLPAAIGAAIANPDKTIICIAGDGSFQMSMHELSTIRDYNLNIKILVMNNGYLGMVRQLQEINCQKRYSQTKISNPDFIKLATAHSIESKRVSTLDNLSNVFNEILEEAKPYLIDIVIEPMEVI